MYFDDILHTYACQHFLTTDMQNHDEDLLSISQAYCGHIVKSPQLLNLMGNLGQILHACLLIFNIVQPLV